MREFWVQIGTVVMLAFGYMGEAHMVNPTMGFVVGMGDWSITVPLQMIEFYLILLAVQPNLGGGMFWRLMIGTVAMLAFGYAGESRTMDPVAGFAAGMAGWFYILYEIFSGEAGKLAGSDRVNKHVAASFGTMRFIVTVGWSIYPLGYFFGYLQGAVSAQALNLVYNLADFVNKIGFCL